MKTLYLLRHAKSSWDNPSLADFERPLNARGLLAAPFMGELMRKRGFALEQVVSSPAVRARATAELVRDNLGGELPIAFDDRIYDASVGTLLNLINSLEDSLSNVMLIGHNPGFEDTARYLTEQIFAMPTAALAVIDLGVDSWSDTAASCGTIREVVRPKDEMKRAGENI